MPLSRNANTLPEREHAVRDADSVIESLACAETAIQQLDPSSQSVNGHREPAEKPTDCLSFSLIIPVFNEEGAIDDTLANLQEILAKLTVPYEIIVVNDGSTDGTATQLEKWAADVRIVRHHRNRGYGASLKTGIRLARHEIIVITDADGSYPNERIPELVRMAKDHDMIVGSRTGDNVTYSKMRSIPKFFLKGFAEWMAQCEIPDLNSGLRVFHKKVALRFLKLFPDGFSFTTTITLAMLTNRYSVRYEPVNYHARIGNSKIQPIRDTLRFTQLILRTGMYFAPLRAFLPVAGLFFAAFSASAFTDIFVRHDLTEATLILMVATTQLGMFALLADMIDKRSV